MAIRKFFSDVWSRLFNSAGEELGQIEDATHRPLYPITPYTAVVVPGTLIRGSWPEQAELEELKNQGVQTVINLCSERDQYRQVIDLGMTSGCIPIRDNTVPKKVQVEAFISLVAIRTPVYVHCEQGKGRTGCMVAAYRVLVQGWTPEAALKEAEQFGLALPAQKEFIRGLKPCSPTSSPS